MKKILVILFLCTIFLSGCSKQEASISVNEDGSSEVEMNVSINKDTFNYIASIMPDGIKDEKDFLENLYGDEITALRDDGFNVQIVDNYINAGFKASKTYISSQDFNSDMNKLKKIGLINSNLRLESKKILTKKTFKIYGDISLNKNKEYDKLKRKISEINPKFQLKDDSQLKLTINLPGNIESINSKKNVWYSLSDSKRTKVYIQSKIRNQKFVVLITIFLVMSFLFLVLYILRKIRR